MSNIPTVVEAQDALMALKVLRRYVERYWPMCDTTDLYTIEDSLDIDIEELKGNHE